MATLALRALSAATKDSDKGFFIMIEGSRIDHAGHGNDPAAQVHEVLAHDLAFRTAVEFVENDSTPGVVVSTSDHETGGLAAARQLTNAYPMYRWFPSVLANASHSSSYLSSKWAAYNADPDTASFSRVKKAKYIKKHLLEEDFGIYDAADSEIDAVINAAQEGLPASYIFADIISRRAQIGWSTHGHSAVDVNIYASDPLHARPLIGNVENTDVGRFLADFLEVDVDAVTTELRKKKVKTESEDDEDSWMGPPGLPVNEDGSLVKLDEYHGDFKVRKREEAEWLHDLKHRRGLAEDCGCGAKH